jgi:hypothetical protein
MILGGHTRTFGQRGISRGFSGVILGLLPTQTKYSLPFLAHQLEGLVDQLDMLQMGSISEALTRA